MTLIDRAKDRRYVNVLARNLYAGFTKDTAGAPAEWANLDEAGQVVWQTMARRAIRKIAALEALSEKK